MSRLETLQGLFRRTRRPGDVVFAWFAFLGALLLLALITDQTTWRPGARLFAQPRFWPAVSLGTMAVFAGLHLLGSALSPRIAGRWREVGLWLAALEYAGWFIAYAALVPIVGYLPMTVLVALALTLRAGYRGWRPLATAGLCALVIVVLFRTLLKVQLPAGRLYDALPEGLRQIMLTHF